MTLFKQNLQVFVGLFMLFFSSTHFVESLVRLETRTSISGMNRVELQRFLSTPSNWPKIVLSSHSVKANERSQLNVEVPMREGDTVEEVFGLPPIVPLRVTWECVVNDEKTGNIEFFSPTGLPSIASACRMKFKVSEGCNPVYDSDVEFVMEYSPTSFLATIAAPLLSVDNNLAIRVLLPATIKAAI